MPMSIEWDHRLAWWESGSFKATGMSLSMKNWWRLGNDFEVEDLEQLAYMIFLKLLRHYPFVYEQKHLMALFKTSLHREFHDLSKTKLYSIDVISKDDVTELDLDESEGTGINEMELINVIISLPSDLKELLYKLCTSPSSELKTSRLPKQSRKHLPQRSTNNEVFCKLIGEDPRRRNLYKELKLALIEGQR